MAKKKSNDTFSHFNTIQACDGRTQMDGHLAMA